MNSTPVESLERRILLATAALHGAGNSNLNLVVTGDNGVSNSLFVKFSRDRSQIIVRFDGREKHFSTNNVVGVQLIGGDQADSLIVDNNRNPFDISCTLIGGRGNDTLIGGDGHNLEIGGSGDDLLVGGTMDDTLVGGGGNDTIQGGPATELIFGGEGDDSITGGLNGNDIIFGGNGNDTIEGSNAGQNEIFGNGGDNLILARSRDTIYGGTGVDTITGSVGSRGESHQGEFSGLNKVLAILNPNVKRFHAAGGARADTSPLL